MLIEGQKCSLIKNALNRHNFFINHLPYHSINFKASWDFETTKNNPTFILQYILLPLEEICQVSCIEKKIDCCNVFMLLIKMINLNALHWLWENEFFLKGSNIPFHGGWRLGENEFKTILLVLKSWIMHVGYKNGFMYLLDNCENF